MKSTTPEGREKLPLSKAMLYLLEECRMVLPGIQALFGFQLTAVFSPGFSEKLGQEDQKLHFLATVLLAVAIVLIMAPAAYHRQTCPEEATKGFIRLSTRLLLASMLPLAVSICLELYIVGNAIVPGLSGILVGVGIFLLSALFWFIIPRAARSADRAGK